MTPIAHAIAKQALRKPRKRVPVYDADTRQNIAPESLVSDIHCFECTEIFDLACDLADSGKLHEVLDERIFLPAPRTWIEHVMDGRRCAFLLSEPYVGAIRFQYIIPHASGFIVKTGDLLQQDTESRLLVGLVLAMLAIINTPQIVSRDIFAPHRGLDRLWQKRLRKAPLNAWRELKLRVNKPIEIDDEEPHAAVIGGRRALHFCRAHLRVRMGRLEFVTSHWRGDPALGTKLTRYKMLAA